MNPVLGWFINGLIFMIPSVINFPSTMHTIMEHFLHGCAMVYLMMSLFCIAILSVPLVPNLRMTISHLIRRFYHPTRYKNRRQYTRAKTGVRIIDKRAPSLKFIRCRAANVRSRPYLRRCFDTDSFPIGIDNHSSRCLTGNINDFVPGTAKLCNVRVLGINGPSRATQKGTLRWHLQDDSGAVSTLLIPNSYYVPNLSLRLLSPQHLAQALKSRETLPLGTTCLTTDKDVILTWLDKTYTLTTPLGRHNVGVCQSAPRFDRYTSFERLYDSASREPRGFATHLIPPDDDDDAHSVSSAASTSPLDEANSESASVLGHPGEHAATTDAQEQHLSSKPSDSSNISPETTGINFDGLPVIPEEEDKEEEETMHKSVSPTQEMLIQHYRLGHLPFSTMQRMARQGALPKRLSTCRVPTCAACRFGMATKVPWKTNGSQNNRKIKTATRPGQCVSVDQMESSNPGFIAQLKGSLTKSRYKYATVFVDHFSDFVYIHLQKTLSSQETVQAKLAFEGYARTLGVSVEHYHADNGRFADNLFLKSVRDKGQTITYCGVGAHWQNGRAEKAIRDTQDAARTMMIHAMHRWPSAIDVALWPYAMRYAATVRNASIRKNARVSPIELFAQTNVRPRLRHMHTFGCPAYVLKTPLQNNKHLPKWESRSRVGIFLGMSPRHAQSVYLILNVSTGLVSPQYHVRFDELFETITRSTKPAAWKVQANFTSSSPQESASNTRQEGNKQQTKTDFEKSRPHRLIDESAGSESAQGTLSNEVESPKAADVSEPSPTPTNAEDQTTDEENLQPEPPSAPAPSQTSPTEGGAVDQPAARTRSGRQVKKPRHLVDYLMAYAIKWAVIDPNLYLEEDKLSELEDPVCFKASTNPDLLYYHEAIKAHDSKEFKQAMVKEVKDHLERGHFEAMLKSDVPEDEVILPAIWSMRRKRRIHNQEVYKWKSRLNLGGHKQVKYSDVTYVPALSWTTIRLFLILSVLNGWHTRQLDWVLAYPQADIPRPTFMELPKGVTIPGLDRRKHCFRVKKNVYGGKDSGRTWFIHLTKGLKKLGFEPFINDECVFVRGTTVLLIYTDDCIAIDKESQDNIDQVIKELGTLFTVEDEGTLEDYLGVRVTRNSDGTITFTQPHLINSILHDLGFTHADGTVKGPNKPKDKPLPYLVTRLIGPDPDGQAFAYSWSFRSVIGKLNFLEKSTRPDISYCTHMCARFMSDPMHSHGEAVKRIGRYLLATRDKGYTISPTSDLNFECYVDADYAGNWDKRIAATDPNTAKSRHGYVVKYAGAPLYWASKLQTMFALSTAESEMIGLSDATRFVKSTMLLLDEVNERFTSVSSTPTVHCNVYEDNSAALEIAKTPKMRPRTRQLNNIYHHFRGEVANGRIKLQAIPTQLQQADFLTKACDYDTFCQHRKSVMGW